MRRRRYLPILASLLVGLVAIVPAAQAAQSPQALSASQLSAIFARLTPDERSIESTYFTDKRWQVLGYSEIWVDPSGTVVQQSNTTPTGTQTTVFASKSSGTMQVTGTGDITFNGNHISITVARDTDIKFEYRYDVVSMFDWIGSTVPWNGVYGDDGFAVYWGNNLALYNDFMWGKYRDGTGLLDLTREAAPPNSGTGWMFWEGKNNTEASIADFGYLTITTNRADYTNTITNFTVKYIHTWINNQFSYAWGSGPSVSFSPSSGSKGFSAYVQIRT